MKAKALYFVDRGRERPESHKAPYHRYILCTTRKKAFWQAGGSISGATVWHRSTPSDGGEGFLILRWKGLDIDYFPVVNGFVLPDGESRTGFVHPHTERAPWSLLPKTVWWSLAEMPDWLRRAGVREPEDDFSLLQIKERD